MSRYEKNICRTIIISKTKQKMYKNKTQKDHKSIHTKQQCIAYQFILKIMIHSKQNSATKQKKSLHKISNNHFLFLSVPSSTMPSLLFLFISHHNIQWITTRCFLHFNWFHIILNNNIFIDCH